MTKIVKELMFIEQRKVSAVFSPSYCLFEDGGRLSHMDEQCFREALRLMSLRAYFIISSAYSHWRKEDEIKRELAKQVGINRKRILSLKSVTDRYDEVRKLKHLVERAGITTLAVVAEKRHMPSLKLMLLQGLPTVELTFETITCRKFERTREPWIKSLRASTEFSWRLWNKLADILTPLIVFLRPL